MSGFSLDGEDYYLEYEGLHWLCTKCGMYGHKAEDCKTGERGATTEARAEGNDACEKDNVMESENDGRFNQDIWKVVQKPRRQKKNGNKDRHPGIFRQQNRGSRYDVLVDEREEDMLEQQMGSTEETRIEDNEEAIGAGRSIKVVRNTRGKKGGMKKRQNMSKKGDREGNLGVVPKTDPEQMGQRELNSRKEKRTRDMVQKELTTFEKSKEEGSRDGMVILQEEERELQVGTIEEVSPVVGRLPILPHDPGEVRGLNRLIGKFWAGPMERDPDCDMVEESPSVNYEGTVVCETQLSS